MNKWESRGRHGALMKHVTFIGWKHLWCHFSVCSAYVTWHQHVCGPVHTGGWDLNTDPQSVSQSVNVQFLNLQQVQNPPPQSWFLDWDRVLSRTWTPVWTRQLVVMEDKTLQDRRLNNALLVCLGSLRSLVFDLVAVTVLDAWLQSL